MNEAYFLSLNEKQNAEGVRVEVLANGTYHDNGFERLLCV